MNIGSLGREATKSLFSRTTLNFLKCRCLEAVKISLKERQYKSPGRRAVSLLNGLPPAMLKRGGSPCSSSSRSQFYTSPSWSKQFTISAFKVDFRRADPVGSRNVAEAARGCGAALVVMISSDKAVDPASVMGATKRLAEGICQALDLDEARRPHGPMAPGTRFVTVRFGNVLGSTGSVVPLFTRQLAAGGPLTVTHPEVSRFFMTVREAVELVLEASATTAPKADGETDGDAARGKIFVLDMGEPVKIVDLARQMIRLAGLRPERDIAISYIGLRPGEKLHEALFHQAESPVPTRNPALRLAAPRTADYAVLARSIDELDEQARAGREARVLDLLHLLVPEYRSDRPVGQAAPAVAAGSS
jgi:FlaA1/EpsC-like NDP-sugar epimerase